MSDLISRQDAIDAILKVGHEHVEENLIRLGLVTDYSDAIRSLPSETSQNLTKPNKTIAKLPTAEPTLRERALMLLLNWAGKKDPDKLVEDLEKAEWYLKRYIDRERTEGGGRP